MWTRRSAWPLLCFAALSLFLCRGGHDAQLRCGKVTSSSVSRGKRVISYALFSPEGVLANDTRELDWLIEGALRNIGDSIIYYPGWLIRVYTFGLNHSIQKRLLGTADNVEVVRCSSDSMLSTSRSRKMIARFLVFDDANVDIAIIRDIDSRFGPRELLAVNEWLSSGMGFHVMRDHDYHTVPIMGGMFGMRTRTLAQKRTSISKLLHRASRENNGPFTFPDVPGEDQAFLAAYVWPLVRDQTLSHDASPNRCSEFGARRCRDFPRISRDSSNFVGAAHKMQDNAECDPLQWQCHSVHSACSSRMDSA